MKVKILIACLIAIVIVVGIYFLLKKPSPKKLTNIQIALQATGLAKENYREYFDQTISPIDTIGGPISSGTIGGPISSGTIGPISSGTIGPISSGTIGPGDVMKTLEPIQTQNPNEASLRLREICDRTTDLVYGTSKRKGFVDVYRDIMKTDFTTTMPKPNCNVLNTQEQINNEFKKLNFLFTEPIMKLLENGEKGYQDLIAIWIFMTYGMIYILYGNDAVRKSPITLHIEYKENGEIDTIEIIVNDASSTRLTPSSMMSRIANSQVKNEPISILANSKLTQADIEQLKADTNSKMTVPTFAKVLIATIAKTGNMGTG